MTTERGQGELTVALAFLAFLIVACLVCGGGYVLLLSVCETI